MRKWIGLLLCLSLLLCGCERSPEQMDKIWSAGFGCVELALPENSEQPLYIAGYHGGWEITGVLDMQQVRALWLDDGENAMVLMAVDCVGLGSDTVQKIRDRLSEFCRETGCDWVNVVATHTHAGVDTLGLWGPTALDGKNDDFMEILVEGAVTAAKMAYADRSYGLLQFSTVETEGLQADSREPQVYDRNLYQLRFVPDDAAQNAIRLISFAAHAEALRGDNTLVSRDYPGVVCDTVAARTGDDTIYLPGAIGGLVMTPVLCDQPFDEEKNLLLTGTKIADAALAAEDWRDLEPSLSITRLTWETPLENTIFLYYKFLGILGNNVRQSVTGAYYLQTELSALRLGDVILALLPGEIFPELVSGTGNSADPEPLAAIAAGFGVEDLVIVGLANDEIGYIVPPSDYAVDRELPYFREAEGDHYEETNSVGSRCALELAAAFYQALEKLK